jgi:hypothetical protein
MSNDDKRLADLQRIASVMADHALVPVAAAAAEVQKIEARIAELAMHRAKLSGSTGDPSIAGAMLAQAERLRIQQAYVLTELASARVRLETKRQAAAQAVGRDQALNALAEKRDAAAKLEARRRALR